MGYILPINMEQATQYVNWATIYKDNYTKLYPIRAPLSYKDTGQTKPFSSTKKPMVGRKQSINRGKDLSQLAGIGLLFDKQI